MPNPSTNRSRGSPHSTQGSRHQESTLNLTRLGGMIMWLPPLNDTLPTHSRLRDQYYHHPVVILSPQASSPTADVVVLIVTSFGETDIDDKFPNNPRLRRAYLPIHPAQSQVIRTPLQLENGAELRKKSYVNTQEKHNIPFHILRDYNSKKVNGFILTSKSYIKLARRAGFELPVNPPLAGIPETIRTATTPSATRTQSERLRMTPLTVDERIHIAPGTYGTVPVLRAPRPSAQDTSTRPLIQGFYNTVQSARQHNPNRSHQPDALLPRYHSGHHAGNRDGAKKWDGTGTLVKLLLGGVVFGATVWGLRSAWTHRVEIGHGFLGGMSWVGAHIFRLIKGVASGLLRFVIWLVKWLAVMGKMGVLKVWEWLRGDSGAHI